jgi:hypothetical protein
MLLSDKDAPTLAKSMTDTLPTIEAPTSDMEEPTRTKFLMENADPS